MVRKGSLIAAVTVAIVIAVTVAAKAQQSSDNSPQSGSNQQSTGDMPCQQGGNVPMGYGMMNHNMMGCSGYAMGPGMMGGGIMGHHGMMMGNGMGMMGGCGGYATQTDLKLSVKQVRKNMEHWLKANGNPHIKLGNVAQQDGDTITAEILTTDKDALVERYEVNRHSGYIQPASNDSRR